MIDWDRVTDLRAEVGPEAFEEVVELFLEEVDAAVKPLRSGGCPDGLLDVLHFLKGSALNLGFRRFADMCRDGEHAATETGACAVDVPAMVDCYDRSRQEFLTRLGADSLAA